MTTIDYKGYRIQIEVDEHDQDSPDAWGDWECFLGEIETRKYNFGRKNWDKADGKYYLAWGEGPWNFRHWGERVPEEEYENEDARIPWADWSEAREAYDDWIYRRMRSRTDEDDYFVFPVYLCDFGGGSIELREGNEDDERRHDGWVYVKRENTPMAILTDSLVGSTPWEKFESLLSTWNQYLSGDVWTYSVWTVNDQRETVDMIDSCGGIYGRDCAEQEARSSVDWQVENATQRA